MSKQSQLQGSPSTKSSLRSRVGGIMRRSSTAIGGFTRPGTPSRSSTESLRLEANAPGPEHVMPSPVAESPAREAAESLPEPVGPSKLSGPSITSPIPAPESLSTVPPSRPEQPLDVSSKEVSAPLVQHTPEPAPAAEVAPAPRSDAAPVSLPESSSTAPPGKLPEAVPVKSVDPAAYVTRSPESLSRAASEHAADEALPVRRSEDSGSTRSHGQVLPSQERQLPTETYAAPWDSGPLVAERSSQPEQATLAAPNPMSLRPNPASIDRVSTPPMAVEAPPIKDSASMDKSSAAGLALKSRTRGSTVSSQFRPRTPPIPNGRISRRPSVSSLASSAAVLSNYPVQPTSVEPRQEGVVAPLATSSMEDPFANPFENVQPPVAPRPVGPAMPVPEPSGVAARNVWAVAPVDVPLPPPSQVVYAMPIQTAPSNLSAADKSAVFSPRELDEYDTDESRPLLRPSTTSVKNPPNYGHMEPTQSVSVLVPQNEGPMWLVPMRQFTSLGWQEILLPDGARYFVNPTLHVVTDIDLRNAERLDAITTFLDGRGSDVLPPPEWELWLREASEPTTILIPLKAWVHHGVRMVLSERPSSDPGEVMNKDIDKTEMEYQYWSFMVSHPAHVLLSPESVSEAIDVLSWSYTDRLLPTPHPSLPPFSQEECQELLTLLRSFSNVSAQTVSIVRTRVVSKVLVRVAAWKQGRHWDGATYQDPRRKKNGPPTRIPLLRTAGDFIVSFICLGLPYLFLERSHHQRFDTEGGVRSTAGPMLAIGALACLIAAIILSASVTFITLPGIDDISRVAGFLAILLSASSLISAVIALFRYKSDIENPIAYPRGEGLVLLSRRSVLLSLPLVFLLYAIAAFIAGVTLYAFRGLTSSGGRHFEDFTQWAVIGTVGGLVCILLTSQTLIH